MDQKITFNPLIIPQFTEKVNSKSSFDQIFTEMDEKIHQNTEKFQDLDLLIGGELLQIADSTRLAKITAAAKKIQSQSEALVCIGVGGSFLGHKALIDAFIAEKESQNRITDIKVDILYAGNSFSSRELNRIIQQIGDRNFSINVISKSGTTLEPNLAFAVLKQVLIKKYGETGAKDRIFVTTDKEKGSLKAEADQNSYTTLPIPDKIGGRYSVFTEVGFLPMLACGLDLDQILAGLQAGLTLDIDSAKAYAKHRELLAKFDINTEILVTFEPSLYTLTEWWKQLFGESEGKHHSGIFPSFTPGISTLWASIFSRDLASFLRLFSSLTIRIQTT